MRFIGIDFGWRGKPSGVAALASGTRTLHLLALDRRTGITEVLAFVREYATDDCAIGVDAPLVIPNATGSRPCDRAMHSHYGRYHAGAYPANLALAHAALPLELAAALEAEGFRHGIDLPPQAAGRQQIEVHPHAAAVQLFALDQIVKYKRGRVAERKAGLERYRGLLSSRLPQCDPPLAALDLPPVPCTGPALKALEDQLDALLAAYIAAHWWLWGKQRNAVHGSVEAGYIVVPHRMTY